MASDRRGEGLSSHPRVPRVAAVMAQLWGRIQGRYRRSLARVSFRRACVIRSHVPVISFTFDDFPRSALLTGGAILGRFGLTGTYYASLGLMGTKAPAGPSFVLEDLQALMEQGHELGSHTSDHR